MAAILFKNKVYFQIFFALFIFVTVPCFSQTGEGGGFRFFSPKVDLERKRLRYPKYYIVYFHLKKTHADVIKKYQRQGIKLPERLVRTITHQTLLGLAHMHKHGFFHRDIKVKILEGYLIL